MNNPTNPPIKPETNPLIPLPIAMPNSDSGITRIPAMGLALDPNQHQAMMEVPTDKEEPGTIVQEMQSGFMIKDRLLRPAMVGVAKKPD